jgi:chemotaxis protein MotA
MNLSAPLGFLVSAFVVYFSVTYGIKNPGVFLDLHAGVIVVGGTLAATLVIFPLNHILKLFVVYFRTITGRTKQELLATIDEVVALAQGVEGGQGLDQLVSGVKNEFLKESLELVLQEGLDDAELEEVLEKRVEVQNERYKREGMTYKIIGKFPPAFGLVGTSLGMIALLQGLGEPNAFERLGPSMSIALVATFYGLVLSNIVIIPVGENLTQASEMDLLVRRVVVDGVRLLRARKHPLLVQEYLKSYLTPNERNRMKKAG